MLRNSEGVDQEQSGGVRGSQRQRRRARQPASQRQPCGLALRQQIAPNLLLLLTFSVLAYSVTVTHRQTVLDDTVKLLTRELPHLSMFNRLAARP